MEATIAHLAGRDGPRLALHERVPAGADEAVLFVHGATYPSRPVFDLPVDGYSWLAATADAGRAALAVDLRGYGESERPVAMQGPPDAAEPPARASAAAGDVRAALDAVAGRFARVHLVGYSWGTVVCGRLLAGDDAPAVASLTALAPVFRPSEAAADRFDPGTPAPAYRTVTREAVRERWDRQFPDAADPAARRGRGGGDDDPVFAAFWRTLADSSQGDGEADAIRAPNGTLLDLRDAAAADPYAPAAVDVPALVVRGSLDPTATREDALGLSDRLGTADDRKEYAEVAGGTHFLPVEGRRRALYALVAAFHDRVERG